MRLVLVDIGAMRARDSTADECVATWITLADCGAGTSGSLDASRLMRSNRSSWGRLLVRVQTGFPRLGADRVVDG